MNIPTSHRVPRRAGFTLAETMMSAGIISTALLAALALLSNGLVSTRDSRIETSASILARRLSAEAEHLTLPGGGLPVSETVLFDASLKPIATSELMSDSEQVEAWYQTGAPQINALFMATVEKTLPPPPAPGVTPSPYRVVVTVEAPASVPVDKRRSYRYVTLSNN